MNIKTYIEGYVISTISNPIGIAFDIFGNMFETMIYKDDTKEFLSFQERYKNCSSAINGHIRAIRNIDKILYEEGNNGNLH